MEELKQDPKYIYLKDLEEKKIPNLLKNNLEASEALVSHSIAELGRIWLKSLFTKKFGWPYSMNTFISWCDRDPITNLAAAWVKIQKRSQRSVFFTHVEVYKAFTLNPLFLLLCLSFLCPLLNGWAHCFQNPAEIHRLAMATCGTSNRKKKKLWREVLIGYASGQA